MFGSAEAGSNKMAARAAAISFLLHSCQLFFYNVGNYALMSEAEDSQWLKLVKKANIEGMSSGTGTY